MSKTMLIDAAYENEVRIAVINEKNELENFDIESKLKNNSKGNVYLARVLRIEPSLQAVFVDYGENRQGFLSFFDIHPKYYNIKHNFDFDKNQSNVDKNLESKNNENHDIQNIANNVDVYDENSIYSDQNIEKNDIYDELIDIKKENVAASLKRKYRVQDVIKLHQKLLVQVEKEERGNKCAALTTYVTLTGRFCIFLPNSGNKNGVSRKIVNSRHRERLKKILDEINVENGNVIVRTSGEKKSKNEIKKDFDYLVKCWHEIDEKYEKTRATGLIYQESCLIKRSLRDMYSKDISKVLIAGNAAYKEAKEYMQNLIPSHSRRLKHYKDVEPIFAKYNIDSQIQTAYSSRVDLPSGGYLMINPTEALVAIDVNSGKATKESDIEVTALKTNLEAAESIHRQLILRNISGLIVIDFIDMENAEHNQEIERKLKKLFKNDKAKVQITKMSSLGLIEISRQRIKPSLTENFFQSCPYCGGLGYVSSVDFGALGVVRKISETASHTANIDKILVTVRADVLSQLMNDYKEEILKIENDNDCKVIIDVSEEISANDCNVQISKKNLENSTQKNNKNVKNINSNSKKYKKYDKIKNKVVVKNSDNNLGINVKTNNAENKNKMFKNKRIKQFSLVESTPIEEISVKKVDIYQKNMNSPIHNDVSIKSNVNEHTIIDGDMSQNKPKRHGWWQKLIK